MRILTWNINGIRTIPQYHPWNMLKNHDAILNHLNADIINFQEVKSSRTALPAPVAAPPSYDAYYSFPLTKNGYSGVATYTLRPSANTPGVTALKAEEGLTGQLRQPHLKPPLQDDERVSRPSAYDYDDQFEFVDLKSLDAEGRALTLDFGLFVLINVYCPNDGSSEEDTSRFDYKMAFHRLLESRVRALIREGREVILLGDINACAAIIDHCEGDIIVRRGAAQGFSGDKQEYFWVENEARRWLRDLLEGEKKCLVDVVRRNHPERRGMFTCWNTKLSARASNYGTRIDYILVTPGLLPWIKAADIEPSMKGSDHCPVWIDLHDELWLPEANAAIKLRDVMSGPTSGQIQTKDRETPRLATRFWDEYSGKQRLLASFFNARSAGDRMKTNKLATPMPKSNNLDSTSGNSESALSLLDATTSQLATSLSSTLSQSSAHISSSEAPTRTSTSSPSNSFKKRKTAPSSSSSPATIAPSHSSILQHKQKKQKLEKDLKEVKKPGQSKLSSFFVASSISRGESNPKGSMNSTVRPTRTISVQELAETETNIVIDLTSSDQRDGAVHSVAEEDNDEDLRRAIQLSLSQTNSSFSSSSSSQEAWKSLLKPPEPPKCLVHNEIAKEFRVNKPGVNKGRSFWVCSRPVGPGYDKGHSERPREEVDSRWKCNFFVWSSDLGAKRTSSTSGK
ncbi:Endonuclease/exonuclease/phosphatase [Lentinula guzmanii]|uniref:DNA-(apurinic or apyrimidinic site) endonuclease n=1 Tax=Lentinula guzmanii TaxID=2804957 RepID=A0AA38N1Y9_9AGAR|nr:Endonuclease/exonuclease/phosphatase [Lentinula guzmanii]